ncbi:MAG: DUF4844 domain-containing protein [Flavobacterium sp.]|nr:MAG: DUF4844 domain-containing protein [Flavobacterium sp.]
MRQKTFRKGIYIAILFAVACGQNKMKTPTYAMKQFEDFRSREKFVEGNPAYYLGLSDESLRPILNAKINQVANDFQNVASGENPLASDYHEKIRIGLQRFSDSYLKLDTEDRERVCEYFEELMDIVNLESSDGQLNNFMYGFDPNEND